jgi:fatty-acyl-CoA synthase
MNPPQAAKLQCLGIPFINTKACILDTEKMEVAADGEQGEILVNGPQVFLGYWKNEEATKDAFIELDGIKWFRTGDLGRKDEDGYYFIADRLKRMINASGFKVWPAEVEALLYRHPDVQEACIIAARDAYRGQTVKAVIVPKTGSKDTISADGIMAWSKETMSAYKVPKVIEFVDELPKTASGKVMWKILQAQQDEADAKA